MTIKKQLEKKLEKLEKTQQKLDMERSKLEREIETVDMEDKRIVIFKHKAGEEGCTFDFDEMRIIGGLIGSTGINAEFRISNFKEGTFGFFINTSSQGNFLLTEREVGKLLKFMKPSPSIGSKGEKK